MKYFLHRVPPTEVIWAVRGKCTAKMLFVRTVSNNKWCHFDGYWEQYRSEEFPFRSTWKAAFLGEDKHFTEVNISQFLVENFAELV